jgi:hypothetical protein
MLNKHLLRRLLVSKNRRFVPGARDWAAERIVKENMIAIVCVAFLYVFMLFVASTLTAVEMHRAHACSKVYAREVLIDGKPVTISYTGPWADADCAQASLALPLVNIFVAVLMAVYLTLVFICHVSVYNGVHYAASQSDYDECAALVRNRSMFALYTM